MGKLTLAKSAIQRIIPVTGQSNAGDGNGLTAADLNAHSVAIDPGIKIWNGSAFTTLINGTNNDILQSPGSTTWGPEVEFCYRWRQANPNEMLYLVPYRVGGTPLGTSTTTANAWLPPPNIGLFSNMTAFLNAAKASLPNPKVGPVLWMQGENDATVSADASNYQANLTTFCNAVRSSWGDADTKILIGRIHSTGQTYASTVQAAQDAVGAALPSFTRVTNTDAFAIGAAPHFSGPGQVSLGGAMYTSYLTF